MYRFLILPHFKKQLKALSKKHRHLKDDLIDTLENFDKKQYQSLGNDLYKIRLKLRDIPRGKNKSFRLIVFVMEVQNYVVPVMVYYRGSKNKVSVKDINKHLEIILFEADLL